MNTGGLGAVLRSAGQCQDCCSSADFQNQPIGGGEFHRLLLGHPVSEQIHPLSLKDRDGAGGKLLIGNSPLRLVLYVPLFPVSLC